METNVPVRWGFLAGVLAGMAMSALMLAIRLAFGIPAFTEVLQDRAIPLVPIFLFSLFIEAFGSYAKQLLFGAVLIGQILGAGVLGMVYAQVWGRNGVYWAEVDAESRHGWVWRAVPWRSVVLFAFLVWLLLSVGMFPILGAGFFGAGLRTGALPVSAALFAAVLFYALILAVTYAALASPSQADLLAPADPRRRAFVRRVALSGLAVVLGGTLVALMAALRRGAAEAFVYRRDANGITPEITPNDKFYVVSKNFSDPQVSVPNWKLEITGLVERPFTLTYAALLDLPVTEQYQTLECISNPIGGDLISTAHWKGVALHELLTQAGLKPGVVDIAFFAEDGYSDSIPLDKALEPTTILAYEMNGVPLPANHGSPVRLLVPGLYGEKNVKWVNKIEAVDYDFKGFWQKVGWSDTARVNTNARIDVPRDGALLALDLSQIGGIAFAGDRGIKRLEVSVDGGKNWQDAELRPALSPFTWVLWSYDWRPPSPGEYKIVVRATDGNGAVQTSVVQDNFPDGPTGLHSITVRVLSS